MRAVILYDGGSDEWSAQDVAAVMANVREVRTALRRAGHEPVLVPVHLGDFRWLTRARKAELVFNLCEGINGKARYEDFVVGALELTGVPFTGCPSSCLSLGRDKARTKYLLSAAGIPTPEYMVVESLPVPRILKEVSRRIVGQDAMVERLLVGMLTGGHILLEGVPGLAKTLAVRTLSEIINASFSRIQFTPDLLPADLIGTMVFDQKTQDFHVKKGPLFAQIILADEINRAPAKVQAALLEAM